MIKVVVVVFLLTVMLHSGSTQVFAESQVTGRVLDSTNNPLMDAQITAKDSESKQTAGATTSDYNGSYRLLLPEGTYDITVISDIGNGKNTKTFANQKITQRTVLDFNLNTKTNGLTLENMDITSNIIFAGLGIGLLTGFAIWVIKKKK